MSRSVGLAFFGLLLVSPAARADDAVCSLPKGLHDGVEKRAGVRTLVKGLVSGASAVGSAPALPEAVADEYRTYFQCLSDTAEHGESQALQSACKAAAGDRLASLVCEIALYLKNGRTGSKEFIEAVPAGKRGADLVWDLDAIAAGGGRNKSPAPAIFLPKGPAYKFLDELFVLVLDDRETAVTRYFAIAASASGEAALYTDEQIKVLLRESPAVVVKEWPVLRLYLPKIKKLVSGMATGAGPEDLLKIRQGLAGFCPSDNLDCPEILKVFGRTDGKNP